MFGVGCISTSAHNPVVYNINVAMASGVPDLCFEPLCSGIYVGDIGSLWEGIKDNASHHFDDFFWPFQSQPKATQLHMTLDVSSPLVARVRRASQEIWRSSSAGSAIRYFH